MYLFPWLLCDEVSRSSPSYSPEDKALVVKYSFLVAPFGLFERYLVNLHSHPRIAFKEAKRHYLQALVVPENDEVHVQHDIDEFSSCIIVSHLHGNSQQSAWNTVSVFLGVLDSFIEAINCCKPSQYVQCPSDIKHLIPLSEFKSHSANKPVVCNECIQSNKSGVIEPWMHMTTDGK